MARRIRQASLTAYINGKLNLRLNSRFRQSGDGGFSWADGVFLSTSRETKGVKRWLVPWVIIGRFGIKFALVHGRWSYLEVDPGDMRSENRLLEAIGRDGSLGLHPPSKKSPIRYLVGSQTLMSPSEMGNGIANRNKTM